jgi:hypothetical protein
MRDPFVGRRTLTPEQWRARGEAIQARLQGLSIDELMRGTHGAPYAGAPVNAAVATTPISHVCQSVIPMAGNGRMMIGGPVGVGYTIVGNGNEALCSSQPPNVHHPIRAGYSYGLREKRLKQSIANWRRAICSAITTRTKYPWRLPRWMARLSPAPARPTEIGILSITLRPEHFALLS